MLKYHLDTSISISTHDFFEIVCTKSKSFTFNILLERLLWSYNYNGELFNQTEENMFLGGFWFIITFSAILRQSCD